MWVLYISLQSYLLYFRPNKSPDHVIVNDEWITRDSQNVLWLPKDYRGCLTTKGDLFVIGRNSGKVNFIKFDYK